MAVIGWGPINASEISKKFEVYLGSRSVEKGEKAWLGSGFRVLAV